MPQDNLPSTQCFGPFSNTPLKAGSWSPPPHVRQCTNPAHDRHFVDTRTNVILSCSGPFIAGRLPGPSHIKLCLEHGHAVNTNTREVIGVGTPRR
jgi:hypothetical protein